MWEELMASKAGSRAAENGPAPRGNENFYGMSIPGWPNRL